jgi:hypothetical protein
MSLRADQVNRVPHWFVPEDNNQPFLDFFVLVPGQDDSWTLKIIQNTVSKKHSTDLEQLKRVLMGVEHAGFSLDSIVVIAFVIENTSQNDLGSTIDGMPVTVTIPCSTGRPKRGDDSEVIKEDQQRWKDILRVKKILFTVTGPTVDGIARTLTRPRLTVTVAQ